MQRLQDNFLELVLFFHCVGPRAPVQALVLVSGSFYTLSYFDSLLELFDRAFIWVKSKNI